MHQNDDAKLSELQFLLEKLKRICQASCDSFLFYYQQIKIQQNSGNFSRFLVWWFTNVDTSESLRVKSGIITAELNSWLIIDADNVRKFISGVRETRVGQKSVKKNKYIVLKKKFGMYVNQGT